MKINHNEYGRRRELPYLFAYDVSAPSRSRQVLQCLRRWRVGGQLSVHETYLPPFQARELAAELLDYVERGVDRLILCRLSQRSGTPVYTLSRSPRYPTIIGAKMSARLPTRFSNGWYLIAYDIRDERRLQRIQRCTAKRCIHLQRSVYLYHGHGEALVRLLDNLVDKIERHVDDLRLYVLNGPQDLWFLSGPVPPVIGLNERGAETSLWQQLLRWIGTH